MVRIGPKNCDVCSCLCVCPDDIELQLDTNYTNNGKLKSENIVIACFVTSRGVFRAGFGRLQKNFDFRWMG